MALQKVAIVGVGFIPLRPATPDVSYKELMYEAAVKAYADCNINPRTDIDSFVCSSEDLLEGTSIFDEYVPDQLGGMLKPVCTVSAESGFALATAYMQILSGVANVCVVEAHSKVSEVVSPMHVMEFAIDPVYNRPLNIMPYYIAGLEMARFLYEHNISREMCAHIVVKNRRNALHNPYAAYGASMTIADVLSADAYAYPLSKFDISMYADTAVVLVLASEGKARKFTKEPIWLKGVGWCTDTPALESREWSSAIYARLAAEAAYKYAKIEKPAKQIDFAEVDDTFSYKELQHMVELKLCKSSEIDGLIFGRKTDITGKLPINPSGGSIGCGYTATASCLVKIAMACLQLRNKASTFQVKNAETCVVQSWTGIPAASGCVFVLSNKK
jgi:acetyl-CoA C-acetyltransferase